MLLACLVATGAAILWLLPPPGGRRLRERLGPEATPVVESPPARWPAVLASLGLGVGLVLVGSLLDRAAGAVVGGALGLVVATVTRMAVGWRGRRARTHRQHDVARACASLAAQLRAGQVPAEALARAAVDHSVLEPGARCVVVGGDVVGLWHRQAVRDAAPGLAELARAWAVSITSGAPMAVTLEQVATAQSAERSLQAVVAGELAAPQATSKIMAALPGCGIGIGYALGGDPLQWLLSGPAGWACLLVGVGLACVGVLWIGALGGRLT